MNLTIYALTTSLLSHSPVLILFTTSYKPIFFEFSQLKLNHYFKSFLSSYSQTINASISKSKFTNFLDPPIKIKITEQQSCISFQNFNNTQNYAESNLCIDSCIFSDCQNTGWYKKGGAILFISKDSVLKIHATFFENCICKGDGGAIFVASEIGDTNSGGSGSSSHKNANSFYSHYCCYSGCSAEIVEKNNKQFSGYGSALFVASSTIELNYSSSLNCPNLSSSESAYGAQFDMQTNDVKSCFINATTGNSICCASIEYRNAKSGFFCFQTIIDQIGGFITSFTSLNGPVNISRFNLVNNTIRYTNFVPSCSIIHVRMKSVTISEFIVVGTKFDGFDDLNHPYFASKGNDRVNELFITIINCIIENFLRNEKFFSEITTTLIYFPHANESVSTHKIGQLNLGDCYGVVEPPLLDATTRFSQSEDFSFSKVFTHSIKFSVSEYFSHSSFFSESRKFSSTNVFSRFSQSSELNIIIESKTTVFSESKQFTITNDFSKSLFFLLTSKFTHSVIFSSSYDFSQSINHSVTIIKDSNKKEKNSKIPLISGIIGAVVVICAIFALTMFLIKKKKLKHIEIEVQEISNVSSSEVIIQNPLSRIGMDDDPFQNDFAEHLASLETVL